MIHRTIEALIIGAIVIASAIVFWQLQQRQNSRLPSTQSSTTQIHVIKEEPPVDETQSAPITPQATIGTNDMMITNGIKHSVKLDDIQGGGPPKDGIPSIDNPRFTDIQQADQWLDDTDPGIALTLHGVTRFYPFRILVWHEIVNDTINGQRVLVTYCPLCFSGVVFDPLVDGERVEFGTSGKLWQSNLVMYDRKTDSLWSQVLGEAVVGEMTGTTLEIMSSDLIQYGDWKSTYPDGQVLSRDTGISRNYNSDPYGNYYTTERVMFPVRAADDRLPNKTFILGIDIDDQAKAYDPAAIKSKGEIVDKFAGRTIIGRYEESIDAVRLYEKMSDGTEIRINPITSYWFAWVGAHPDTQLYQ